MLNLNVGILGHVDCGKTSLAKVLSEVSSTASFDKNPQSQERGITLDLGFSSFTVSVPKHLVKLLSEESDPLLQFTLVDCPGHASLIRTIIGGAQIIDMMLLVIDATKGLQTQTAECLIIGELTCKKMIIVVNKTDLLPDDKQKTIIAKITKKLKAVLSNTIFKDSPFVYIAANPSDGSEPVGIKALIEVMSDFAFLPRRDETAASDFVFAVDHCFGIKGQGTIMTGTVLQGSVQINDNVHIPALNLSKKVKSMQMFHNPIQRAVQGDRIGICVTQFDPKLFERGIVCAAGIECQASLSYAVIIIAEKIKYFNFPIKSKSKFHISIGYETNMATITCFSISKTLIKVDEFNSNLEYKYCDEFHENAENSNKQGDQIQNYMILEFDKPVLTFPNSLIIGSKLDIVAVHHPNTCRLAFWGTLLATTKEKDYKNAFLQSLKIFKTKQRAGTVERMLNETEIIVKNMFKKKEQVNVQQFLGLTVSLSTGESGNIVSQFGQSGKIKVFIKNGLNKGTIDLLQKTTTTNKKNNTNTVVIEPVKVILEWKRYVYDVHKKIIQ